jgi:archaellum component FlaF (FlaF/FlaG flagellin family)
MAAAIVTIICIAMIIVGGMTLSQGIITSADSAAISVESISVREGDMMRTDLNAARAVKLSWADYLRVTVMNNGQTKLASFDKWDVIVSYTDNTGATHSTWLRYSDSVLGDNKWQKARIGLYGPTEFFEPGILNPSEEIVILARLNPLAGASTEGDISLTTPNGIYDSMTFFNLGYTRLTPQSENITIANTKYYELVEAAPADGTAIISRADFSNNESARKILYNVDQPTRPAKHIFPLIGINQIPAGTWTFYYRCFIGGDGEFPQEDNDACFNVDIMVRQADGSLRATIATGVASAFIAKESQGVWVTLSGTYNFPGYTVVDENDYLEIDYYGQTTQGPDGGSGYMQLSVDDSTLPVSDQTRIKA